MARGSKPEDYADYASLFTADVQHILNQVRRTIQKAASEAHETISYGMPAFRLDGAIIVWFAAFANHIGFYPGASGIAAFKKELGDTGTRKVRCSFQSTSRSHSRSSRGSCSFERRNG